MPATETIARIMATGYNRHIRDHGPDGSYAGEAVEAGDGHAVLVVRGGGEFAVRVTRVAALSSAGPLTPGQCWAALKDYLGEQIDADHAVMQSFADYPDDGATSNAHGSLVAANRNTLAKMRELEAGR